jgi:hypothetical protein
MPKLATPTASVVAFQRKSLGQKPCQVPPRNAPSASARKASAQYLEYLVNRKPRKADTAASA